MTDTMTTAPATEVAQVEAPPRPAMIGVLARAEAAEQAALARVAQLEAELTRLRTEQITDGADPRLIDFWEKAGRIADHADFCEEYDRLAEAMNGTPREREWDVTLDITVSLRVSRTVTARDAYTAIEDARDGLDRDEVIEAVRMNGWDDLTIDNSEAERS